MKPIDFDKTIETRGGAPVELITREGRGTQPLIGYMGDNDTLYQWNSDGKYFDEPEGISEYDLVNVPEKRVIWLNVYPSGKAVAHTNIYDAEAFGADIVIARIRVEYIEGQFDE